ncbi:hypothetical protein FD754_004007, partial [Muntiacus muntjak]
LSTISPGGLACNPRNNLFVFSRDGGRRHLGGSCKYAASLASPLLLCTWTYGGHDPLSLLFSPVLGLHCCAAFSLAVVQAPPSFLSMHPLSSMTLPCDAPAVSQDPLRHPHPSLQATGRSHKWLLVSSAPSRAGAPEMEAEKNGVSVLLIRMVAPRQGVEEEVPQPARLAAVRPNAVLAAVWLAEAVGKPSPAPDLNLALGIGIQNFPEGLAVSLPLRGAGFSTWRAFWYGQLSGMVEPLAGVFGAFAVVLAEPILPYALAFAAGAMVYVIMDDIIPEAQLRGAWWASVHRVSESQTRLKRLSMHACQYYYFLLKYS